MNKTKLMLGDNIESLKKLPDNSIDSVVTDPPYGLSFMNKKWDYDVPSVDFWKEVYRVLKPGGHILSFGGTRTYHRMVVNIEDAGFEIRDQIMWIYGSGFPKSLNISKKIEQDIDNLIYSNIWKNKLDNVKIVEPTLKKNQIEVGNNIKIQGSAHESVVGKVKEKQDYQSVIVVEKIFTEVHHILKDNPIVQESVEQFIIQQQDLVKCVEQLSEDQIVKLLNIFIVEESVKDMLKDYSMNKTKVEEVQKTLNGNEKFSVSEIIPVLCVVLTKILKHIILNQSRTFQNLDTKSQMDYVSATSVTITKYIMEHLIGNTVSILKRRIDFTIDNGHSALKPANEPICVARKPLSEKSIAENVMKWGTGGINIDGCRIGNEIRDNGISLRDIRCGSLDAQVTSNRKRLEREDNIVEGRFPANLIFECICDELEDNIHTNPDCPCRMLDENNLISNPKKERFGINGGSILHGGGWKKNINGRWPGDSGGGVSRFFYNAKVSKSERNMGLDGFEEKGSSELNGEGRFPANLIFECICGELEDNIHTNPDCPCRMLDEQSGLSKSTNGKERRVNNVGSFGGGTTNANNEYNDKGGASRFFYNAKVSKSERNMGLDGFEEKGSSELNNRKEGSAGLERKDGESGTNPYLSISSSRKNSHPTVKPINLMTYLCRLVTPKNGIVLDPFMGSGSTGISALLEGFRFCGMEMDEEYFKISEARIDSYEDYRKFIKR